MTRGTSEDTAQYRHYLWTGRPSPLLGYRDPDEPDGARGSVVNGSAHGGGSPL